MKVSGPTGPSSSGGVRSAASSGSATPFKPIVADALSGPSGAASASGVTRVSSLDALMALQEVGGPLERRRRAVGRATQILDALDTLKADLLAGALSPTALAALSQAVRDQRALTDDPRLEGVLDEIETRAAVELAKVEMARAAA